MTEIITGQDVQDMYLETEHGTFTPIYEYEHYDQETDSYIGFKVTKTAEEMYNEWLTNKDKPFVPVPTPEENIEALQGQVVALEDELMVTNQYMTDLELELFELKAILNQ